MNRTRHLSTVALLLCLPAISALAQSSDAVSAGVKRSNVVSANPIGFLFQWYNGEFEHAVSPTVSLAVATSIFTSDVLSDSGNNYYIADVIARYYPAARASRGFSVGVTFGMAAVNEKDKCTEFSCADQTNSAATVGVRGDYVWILGRRQHFVVATGIGARRVVGGDISNNALPIGRISLGYAW